MVALRKLFQQERSDSRLSTSPSPEANEPNDPCFGADSMTLESGQLSPGLPSPGLYSPGSRVSQAIDVAHRFEQIEKQFEDLHQQLETARPLSSQSHLPPGASNYFGVPRLQNSLHIDLLDAAVNSQRHQQETSFQHLSPPTSPYNEDVAERNMTRFLRIQHRNGSAGSRILSALYQEDVADRNIAKYGGQSRSLSSLSCRSSPPAPGRVRSSGLSNKGRWSKKRNPGKSTWTSDGDLRNRSSSSNRSSTDNASSRSSQASRASSHLRAQRSAPSLPTEESNASQEDAIPAPVQRLGVPPAHKQGKRWSNTPLPDSPTLPLPIGDGSDNNNVATHKPIGTPSITRPPVASARSSSLTARSRSPPPSRKNVRDLSIDVQLAAQGRPKIAHKAIQPPTPSNYEMKRAPSIAEVMNSPLPTSSPQPSPRFKVSEMMDLFNKAYMSTQAVSPHPTYETLQDAIVREINSHEAFRRVPVPAAGPPFTPSPTQEASEHRLNRSASAGHISKMIRKGSLKKHKRNSDSQRSISTSLPAKSILRRVSSSPARRRHTDAPAPSPALFADIQQAQEAVPRATEDQMTYMDVLFCTAKDKISSSESKNTPIPRKRDRSESTSNIPTITRSNFDMPNTPAAVYTMQAHSTPFKDGRSSGSHEDSDDDIIHLPSVGAPPPRVTIEGVDENNVRYVIDSATATDAHKLMNWPQRGRREHTGCENGLSPLSRARTQLRGTRSVETY